MAFSIFKLLRSITPGNRPSGQTYGIPYVNFGDNQFGVFDSSNTARDLIGVPHFSASATYVTNNPVNYQGTLYTAKGAVSAGAWNASLWAAITGSVVPSGTVMLFWQSAAPVGWTQVTTQNDKALRVVSGTGGVSGGTNAFSAVMAQTVVGNTSPSSPTMFQHTHPVAGGTNPVVYVAPPGGAGYGPGPGLGSDYINNVGGSAAHNHSITMQIQYIDLILATKQ
jgi:hypothetical protein